MPLGLTPTNVLNSLHYYGLKGDDARACRDAYMERVEDGNPPDLAEFAEAWAALS